MRSHEARRKSIHNLAGKQNKQTKNKDWGASQLVEYLPSMREALSFIPSTAKNWVWWCTPVIPALKKREKYELKVSLATEGDQVGLCKPPSWVREWKRGRGDGLGKGWKKKEKKRQGRLEKLLE